MAGLKKIMLTETESKVDNDSSSVMKQLEKFDNTYTNSATETSKKLENLYNEFDSITFNNSNTISANVEETKTAVMAKTSLKVKVYLACAIITTIMLMFLAIYNIFVIKNMNSSISLLQAQEITKSAELENLITENSQLQDSVVDKVKDEFAPIDENNKVIIDLINKQQVENLSVESNWFDALCNFLSNLFK